MINILAPQDVTLVEILASVDSLFSRWPGPHAGNAVCFEVHSRQRQYLAGHGLPWRTGGGASERKQGERTLITLGTQGHVITHKADRSHRHVALTDTGDDHARSLLGFYRCCDCWNVFRALAAAIQAGPGKWATAKHITEALGEADQRSAWALLYPLLAHGLAESFVDTRGRTVFTVHPKHWPTAAGDPPALLADPKPDERLNPIFWAAFDAAERDKRGWKPRWENSVLVPVLN